MKNSDEDLWNRILLVVEVGDNIRFKHGKTTWKVLRIYTFQKSHYILVARVIHHRLLKGRPCSWNESRQKRIRQGTWEYRNIRIIM